MLKKLLVICGTLFLVACSSSSKLNTAAYPSVDERNDAELSSFIGQLKTNRPHQSITSNPFGHHSSTFSPAQRGQKLAQVYNKWVGTRYRLGGTGRGGIDCSAFMQTAFATAFGMSLPRSTSEQRFLGQRIQKHQLKQGDLVFFRRNNHVGVYIGNNKFMHASSSQGVTISSLNESYWSRTYTQSRRVL
ncbi:endopeptidase [Actinobacillus succinogenes]|nr:NlpC/P60 family protein [Actinobacillus succinogenes]PHI41182.1 endopeptidase [Actinobacillus succinogenes]